MLTFSSAIQAYLFVTVLAAILLFMNWPRNRDGSLVPPEELQRWMENRSFHEPPRRNAIAVVSAIVMAMICIAYALAQAHP